VDAERRGRPAPIPLRPDPGTVREAAVRSLVRAGVAFAARANSAPLLGSRLMGKRRSDATGRRFTDEFDSVRVSRFRATGVIDPLKREALIPWPNGKTKLIRTAHTRLKYGGGWSFFVCPQCAKLAQKLYSIDDRPLCWLLLRRHQHQAPQQMGPYPK
jgi:hypothetical protein